MHIISTLSFFCSLDSPKTNATIHYQINNYETTAIANTGRSVWPANHRLRSDSIIHHIWNNCILHTLSLINYKWLSLCYSLIDSLSSWRLKWNLSNLILVMALCHQAINHFLSQCWPVSMSPYGVTRPQWVSCIYISGNVDMYIRKFKKNIYLLFSIIPWWWNVVCYWELFPKSTIAHTLYSDIIIFTT